MATTTETHPGTRSALAGRVAIVTGASSGIGHATVTELARRGARVLAAARRGHLVEELAAELRRAGHDVQAMTADVTREEDVAAMVASALQRWGRIDVAFNNAGTEGTFAPFVELTDAHYGEVFGPNVRGVFLSMLHIGRAMLAQGSGSIINNASMGGVIGFAGAALYVATKHAVVGLTKTASLEWFPHGVRVNALAPGLIDTPFQDRIWPTREAKEAFFAASAPRRAGSAEEMARVVAFLASDDAAYVSGHTLLADGGYSVA